MNCPKCDTPIERRPGPGRPAIFCSETCRSAAAYEVKRLQRRLEGLETRLSSLRHGAETHAHNLGLNAKQRTYHAERRATAAAEVQAQIDEAEARFRLLLSEPRGKPLQDKEGHP